MGLQCGFKGHKVGLNMQHRHLNHRHLEARWHDWNDVASACRQIAVNAFDRICGESGGT